MNKILISIIVPIYNTEQFLRKCIDSMIQQTYDHVEIVLVDDGSTDKSLAVCQQYADKDKRILLLTKANGGASEARNLGVSHAKGTYILFVDSDDYIELDACEEFAKAIGAFEGIDIVASNIKSYTDGKEEYELFTAMPTHQPVSGGEFLKHQLMNKSMRMSACRNIYHRDFFEGKGFLFKIGLLHEDEEWTPRIFLEAKKVILLNEAHYIRVKREGSITRSQNREKNTKDLLKICYTLEKRYAQIQDKQLKALLNDYLAMLFLYAFYFGSLNEPKDFHLYRKDFLNGKAMGFKHKVEVGVFKLSKKLYRKLYQMRGIIQY